MKVVLIGEKLNNQLIKEIAIEIGFDSYEYKELNHDEMIKFVQSKDYEALNVSFPYKKEVIPYLDELSDLAKEVGAVDTIVNMNGKKVGYNTDYYAFEYMLNKHHISLNDKKVLIIGNGGTSISVQHYAKNRNAKEVNVLDINGSKGSISYIECFSKHLNSDIVINTCPVGKAPGIDNAPIDMNLFSNCEAMIDVIYDPILTRLGLDAQENDIKRIIGIEMLIAHLKKSYEIIENSNISDESLDQIIHKTLVRNCNIVLIGMPSAGKTTIGKMIAERLGKTFIDMDQVIVDDTNMSVPEIFAASGEAGFRKLETLTALKLSKLHNMVIGTGGGTIKNKINMDYLRLNGIIFFIDRDLELLITNDPNRPLSKDPAAVAAMYKERYPIYQKYATVIVDNNESIDLTVETIINSYHRIATNAVNE